MIIDISAKIFSYLDCMHGNQWIVGNEEEIHFNIYKTAAWLENGELRCKVHMI